PALRRELGCAGRGDRRARRPRVPAAQLRDEPRRTAAAAGRLRADGPGVRAVVRELRPVPRRRCAGRLRVATARRRHRAPGGELRAARVAARLGRAARGERGLPARAGAGAGGLVTQRKVAILGVGLIGASLAAALSRAKQGWHVAGYSPGDDAQVARALGYLDTACATGGEAVEHAAFVVVAAPVPAMPSLFAQMREALDAQAIVTDCGSTKRSVIEAARAGLGDAFLRFVPGHPIAGSEHSGAQAADPDLF